MIAALHDSKEQKARAYVEAPFDLLYGCRGQQDDVDLLSPYEMLRHWSLEKIIPPSAKVPAHLQRSRLTSEGANYKKQCQRDGLRPDYQAGLHYEALPAPGRILMPAMPALRSSRPRWCLGRSSAPRVPVCAVCKMPGEGSASAEL